MRIEHTGRGPLAIADRRDELDVWSMTACLHWLLRNDPNGEWSNYIEDFDRAVEDCGELSVVDARDIVWSQMLGE